MKLSTTLESEIKTMTDTNKDQATVDVTATETEKQENTALTIARIGLYQYAANASLSFPDSYTFHGTKLDGSLATVTLTSAIEMNEDPSDNQWFSLTVSYMTSVKATNLDKSPLVIDGKSYKRPSEKLAVLKPLIKFNINKLGVISNDQVTNDFTVESGIGASYGQLVFPYMHKMVDKWSNPLTLLFILLFTRATQDQDNTLLTEDGTANFKPLAYKSLTTQERLECLVNHHNILVELNHNSQGNFSKVAKSAAKVLDKIESDKLAATKQANATK